MLLQQLFSELHEDSFRDNSLFHDLIGRLVRAVLYDAVGKHGANAIHGEELLPCCRVEYPFRSTAGAFRTAANLRSATPGCA